MILQNELFGYLVFPGRKYLHEKPGQIKSKSTNVNQVLTVNHHYYPPNQSLFFAASAQ
jgi:hypothetical protein